MKYRVNFDEASDDVIIEDVGVTEHCHEREVLENGNKRVNYDWTEDQTDIIRMGVLNQAIPTVIMRDLKRANLVPVEREPSRAQLNNNI